VNHTYRLVWNDTVGAYVVAAENARGRTKGNGLKLASAAVLSALAFTAHALPTDGVIAAGSGSIGPATGGTITVDQTSQNLAINWQTFNIGAGEKVHFVQPNSSAIALNRVLGAGRSEILGQLSGNGQVWILNPNGVLFGKTAEVNVGGLVASTLGMSVADFMAGKRTFSGSGGSVTNQGEITAGYVALLGEQVKNEGTIVANLGTVALAAGDRITLDFDGDKLLNVQIDEGALHALVDNKNLIQADGGMVLMTAKAKNALLGTAVNNSGIVRARTIANHNGVIKLLGDMRNGTVNVGGTLDASAPNGGNGGFVETSAAHVKIADGAKITTQAANGLTGSWLIDPVDFTIAAGSGALTTSGIGATTLSNSLASSNVAIATSAATAGNGDIFVTAAVSWSANKLTLTAHRNININANLNGSGTASLALEYGQGAVAAGNTSNYYVNGAKVHLPAGANFSTKLGSNGATTPWTVITSLGVEGDATVAPGVMTLQGMNTGLAGNYVLGADIDATATAGWNAGAGFVPVGASAANFTGSFDGLGHTVTGLTINRQVNVAANFYQGLFGYSTGALRNVGMLNSNIYGASVVGALAGYSGGSISYSYADGGSVTASVHQAGGLVGQLGGSISNSYANVSVSGTDYACCGGGVSSSSIGGLVGKTLDGSSISNSYSTGSVNGSTYVGGLVGQNRGDIDTSYASGAVTKDGGLSRAGGLIGDHLAGTISNSYWDSVTTGQAGTGGCSGGGCLGVIVSLTDIAAAPYAQASYTGLDFTNTWRIYEGHTRPLLKSFLKPLTVTANDASKTYDGLAYSGGNGVSYSSAPDGNLLGSASYGGTSQGAANAGSYTIAAGGFYSNQHGYDISYVDGTLTVNQATLTVTANNAGKTYDGLAYSGGNGVSYAGFVNGETSSVLGGTLAYGGASQGAVNAGNYAITASGLTSGNYTIGYVDGTLTVNQAALTVTANNGSKTFDGLAWSGGNGVSYAGFVGGENPSVLGGTLAWGGTSQGAVHVGSYVLTPSGLTSGNYALSFVDGTLTIASAVPTVPGAPDGYSGAITSLSGGTLDGASGSEGAGGDSASGTALLASADDAAPGLPGVPGFSIHLCGQNVPPGLAETCK